MAGNFDLLRDPAGGGKLVGEFVTSGDFPTGVLKGAARDYPVLGGVVVMRDDLATEEVTRLARVGKLEEALYQAVRIQNGSDSETRDFLRCLKEPRSLQSNGSPHAGFKGAYGIYFRYRYSIANTPSTIGLLSCLKRTAPKDGYFLDIGSGLGHFYRYYLHSYAPEKIVLADFALDLLIAAARFVDPRTLLVCHDANLTFPFRSKLFTDITMFNAFQCIENKESFVQSAIDALDPSVGTFWITNNWNPKITDQFTLAARAPTEWRAFCRSEKWRLFPERHFAAPVLHGGLVNLGVQYVPQDNDPAWRATTLAYSNASWESHNKCVPLNAAPKWQQLAFNSVYYRHPFRKRLIKKKVSIKYWDSHTEYYGFNLPQEVILSGGMDRRTGRGLQPLVQSLIMVEALCADEPRPIFEFAASLGSWLKDRCDGLISEFGFADAVKGLVPRSLKVGLKKFLTAR